MKPVRYEDDGGGEQVNVGADTRFCVAQQEEDKELNDSFAAEDNDNELSNCAWPTLVPIKRSNELLDPLVAPTLLPAVASASASTSASAYAHTHTLVPATVAKTAATEGLSQCRVCPKTQTQGHFELEMHKHGLLDEIVHIQQLNDYFEAELGTKKEGEGRMAESRNSPNTTVDKQLGPEKGYAFPFQKRARSQSPPRNGALFGSQSGDELRPEVPTTRKPVVATVNFVIGKATLPHELGPKPQFVETSAKALEPDDVIDSCGLSTGPTDEGRNNQKLHLADDLDNEWLYQRIDNNLISLAQKEESPPSHSPSNDQGKAGGGTFLQLLSNVKFDT